MDKKKTEEKELKKRRREKENQIQPVIELRPFNAPGHSFSTRPRKTQCENFWKYIIKNLSPGTPASVTCLKLIEPY